jgi:hypothetical protein
MASNRISAAEQEVLRQWLRGAIKMSGLSPSGLAKKAGVAQTTVPRFLNHNVDYAPGWSTISKLAAAAKVEPISPRVAKDQLVTVGPMITVRKPMATTPTPPDADSLVPDDLSPDERLAYLLSFRRAIEHLYVRLTHGSYKYPEVAENIAEPLAAVAQLDAWLHTQFQNYTPHRAAQQAALTTGGKQKPRSRSSGTGRKRKPENQRRSDKLHLHL